MTARLALSSSAVTRDALGSAGLVEAMIECGAEAVLLDGRLPRELLEPLALGLERRRGELPVLALETPCPWTRESTAELCAPDRAEAEVALQVALAGVRRAAALEARFAVVRLGAVRALEPDWARARARFLRGQLEPAEARRLADERRQAAGRAIDAARRALEPLAREAERGGLTVLLRNGRRYIDVPSASELERLLADSAGAPLDAALDVPAAHLQDVMGFAPLELTLDRAAFGRAPLVYLADACGPVGGLSPGHGELDLAAVAARLPENAAVVFSPWAGLDAAEARAAFQALRCLLGT